MRLIPRTPYCSREVPEKPTRISNLAKVAQALAAFLYRAALASSQLQQARSSLTTFLGASTNIASALFVSSQQTKINSRGKS